MATKPTVLLPNTYWNKTVIIAENGAQAIADYDVILMDQPQE